MKMKMKKEYDKLAERMALILSRFNDGDSFTVEELSEEFAVSKRTIQRDFQRLFTHLPIEKNGNRYTLPQYCLGKLSFHDIKRFATFSGLQSLYPELDNSLIVDILNVKINKAIEVNGHKYEDLSRKVDIFNELAASIITQSVIHCTYKEKPRMLQPYKLVNTNGIWYLVAVEKNILKNFAFGKICHLKVPGDTFEKDEEILEALTSHEGQWFSQNHIEVEIEVDISVAEYFLRRELLPHQNILESTEERLLLSAKVAYEEEILRTIRYWIPHLTIRTPEYLQEKLVASLEHYLQQA